MKLVDNFAVSFELYDAQYKYNIGELADRVLNIDRRIKQ